jgi:2-polyprenyl-3-methyl-5-hydroxy-6-metoxy-1,4-benzoquinol methylase/uncharacterized protein YbaR (Trm112 family)
MREITADYFICPACCSQLQDNIISNNDEPIFACVDCKSQYHVINNIPRFITDGDYCHSFGLQWNRHKKTQIDKYTGFHFTRDRLFSVTGWAHNLKGQTLLEAGSGAGRFTEILLETEALVYSFDYSSAVDVNFENNGGANNLILFQADIYHLPLNKQMFDKVLCLGVLQHTPDPKKAFLSLAEFVRPGGKIVIDVYKKTITSILQWKYLLRPLLKRMDKNKLYAVSEQMVNLLSGPCLKAKKAFGNIGGRLFPIAEYSHLGLPATLNREWSILDTFDMFAPEYDIPQTRKTVCAWFREAGLVDILVEYGPNGIIGRARRPHRSELLCAE